MESTKTMNEVGELLPHRILTKYREAKEIMDGDMPSPRFADVYPVYGCNHNCIGCDYTDLNMKPRMLTYKNFKHIIYELDAMGCEAIDYCGGGEPTLNENLPPMIELWCEDFGHKTGILTNGTMMSGRLRDVTLDWASYVRFSLECATKETFNTYKRPKSSDAGWDTVITNLRETVKQRNETGSKCLIGYKYTIDNNNFGDIPQAFKLASEIGVDSLQFKLIRNVPSELDTVMQTQVSSQIAGLALEYPNLKVMGNLKPYVFRGGCWLNPLWPTIDAFGDIWICCYYRHRRDNHWLGNIFDDNLNNIWKDPEHMKKISKIQKKECLKYDCRFMKYNDYMKDILLDHKGQVEFL